MVLGDLFHLLTANYNCCASRLLCILVGILCMLCVTLVLDCVYYISLLYLVCQEGTACECAVIENTFIHSFIVDINFSYPCPQRDTLAGG